MYFLNGWISELGIDDFNEVVPRGVLELGWFPVVVRVTPVFQSSLDPPIFCGALKKGRCEGDHQGRNSSIVVLEHVEVCKAVT